MATDQMILQLAEGEKRTPHQPKMNPPHPITQKVYTLMYKNHFSLSRYYNKKEKKKVKEKEKLLREPKFFTSDPTIKRSQVEK